MKAKTEVEVGDMEVIGIQKEEQVDEFRQWKL